MPVPMPPFGTLSQRAPFIPSLSPSLPSPFHLNASLLLPIPLLTPDEGTSKGPCPPGGGQGGPRSRGGTPEQAQGGGAAVPRAAGEHGEGPGGRQAAGVDYRAATTGGAGRARRHGSAQAQHRREFSRGSRRSFGGGMAGSLAGHLATWWNGAANSPRKWRVY